MESTESSNNLLSGWSIATINSHTFSNLGSGCFLMFCSFPTVQSPSNTSFKSSAPAAALHGAHVPKQKGVLKGSTHAQLALTFLSQKLSFLVRFLYGSKHPTHLDSKCSKNSSKKEFILHFFFLVYFFLKEKKNLSDEKHVTDSFPVLKMPVFN